MNEETLLEKAKGIKLRPRGRKKSLEEIELAVAWALGEVDLKQVQLALELSSNSYIYSWLCQALRNACEVGFLKKPSN